MDNKKKEEEEKLKKEIHMKAAIAAEKEILLKKKEEDRKKRKEKEKSTSHNNNKYKLKIFYKIPKFSGEKVYEYTGKKASNKLERIYVNNKVQYFNESHPNHLKKGIVRKWEYIQEPLNVKFEIIFNDPPFVYEKNTKTGQLYKTNKKIKIIENVPFKYLKGLEESKENEIVVKQSSKILKKNYNLRKGLESEIINKKNLIVKFYRVIIFLIKLGKKLTENPEKSLEEIPKEKEGEYAKIKEKNEKIIGNTLDNIKKENSSIYASLIELYAMIPSSRRLRSDGEAAKKKLFSHVFTDNVIDFNFLFNKKTKEEFLKILEKQNIDKIKKIKENAYDFFDKILKSFGERNLYNLKLEKKDFFINNDIDYYKFINGVMKKESEITKMKFITYQEIFEKEIKSFITKKFIKNDQFFPKEVKIKYTNKTTTDKKEFYNNPDKLVEPTDDKVFTINKYDIIDTLTQENDYTENNGKNTEKKKMFIIEKVGDRHEYGIIKIILNIDLDMKDLLTNDELINENKGDSTLRMIGDFFGNIGNNLNCDVSRRNFNDNLDKLKKTFRNSVAPPELLKDDNEKNEDDEIEKITSIQRLTPEISVVSGSFKKKSGKKSLKKNIKSSRNRTLKNH